MFLQLCGFGAPRGGSPAEMVALPRCPVHPLQAPAEGDSQGDGSSPGEAPQHSQGVRDQHLSSLCNIHPLTLLSPAGSGGLPTPMPAPLLHPAPLLRVPQPSPVPGLGTFSAGQDPCSYSPSSPPASICTCAPSLSKTMAKPKGRGKRGLQKATLRRAFLAAEMQQAERDESCLERGSSRQQPPSRTAAPLGRGGRAEDPRGPGAAVSPGRRGLGGQQDQLWARRGLLHGQISADRQCPECLALHSTTPCSYPVTSRGSLHP